MLWLARCAAVSMVSTFAWGVLAVTLINARYDEIVDQMLSPAFTLCDLATPDEWQTLGNIPLGIFWLTAAIALYGVATGVAVCIASDFCRPRSSQGLAEPTRAAAPARHDIQGTS
jgi:hypothetical protein